MTLTLPFAPGVAAAQATVDAENPWPGLESFRERDQAFFRGRDADAEELARRVRREGLCVVLFGQSGLGKSSILHAGLFPRLREQLFLPVSIRIAYDDGAPSPREQVLRAVAAQAAAHGAEAPHADPAETLWEYFHRTGNEFWSADNRPAVPLLVFDQFEEAFTLGRQTREREVRTAAFLEELGDLIEGRPSREVKARLNAGAAALDAFAFARHEYKVMLVIREDFLAELETLTRTVRSLAINRMRLEPLRGDQALLVTAAGGPALVPPPERADEPGVGERIVRLVAGEPPDGPRARLEELVVDPPLLSLFCRELNERRKARGQDAITADLVEGNREGILEEFYERSLRGLDPGVRLLVEDRLLTVDNRRDSIDLENALRLPGVTAEAVAQLVERRLVRREDRGRGSSRIELTHDVLTGAVGVVARSRDRRRAEEAAAASAQREREESERLKALAEKRAEEDRAAAAAARAEAEIAQRRARRAAVAVLALLLLAVYGWYQRNEAVKQRGVAEQNSRVALAANVGMAIQTRRANSARDTALAATRLADSARNAAVAAESVARVSEAHAQSALTALRDTARALRDAEDSVRRKELEATVSTEAADQYLDLTRRMQFRQLVAERERQSQMQQFDDLEAARDSADRRNREIVLRVGVLETAVCGAGREDGAVQADSAAGNRLRMSVRRRLAGRRLPPLPCEQPQSAAVTKP